MPSSFEPDILRLGKAFDLEVSHLYLTDTRDALALAQPAVARGSGRAHWDDQAHKSQPPSARLGRTGRADLILRGTDDETRLPFYVVIEAKNTDWDTQQSHRIKPNVDRHRRQLWSYLEPLLDQVDEHQAAYVQGALLYPKRPKLQARANEIVEALAAYGVTVLWHDELPVG
jgi:hypothetical protein